MTVQVVYVTGETTLTGLEAEIRQASARHVLFVMPARTPLLTERLDLARLRQLARELNVRLGLVSLNPSVMLAARHLDVPVYPSIWLGERRLERPRPWWRPAPPRRPGRATAMDEAERRSMHRRLTPLPAWRAWLNRYMVIVFFFITLAILAIAGFYVAPHARLTLKPYLETLRVTRQIVADPQIDAVNFGGATVPGRILVVLDKWQASLATSGTIRLPNAPARGLVVFANQIPQKLTIPAGTRISTSTGDRLVYQTVAAVEAPATIGGQVEAEVVALTPGAKGNVEIGRINRIEGPLAAQLNVRNLKPITGGTTRPAPTATQGDYERLRNHVLETLRTRAITEMTADLDESEFLAEDSVRVVLIYYENYSHSPGQETNTLTMEMRVALHGTAVPRDAALSLIYDELKVNVRKGFILLPDSIRPKLGNVVGVDSQGRVSLILEAEATLVADLPVRQVIAAIRGQDIGVAASYLGHNLLLREPPTVQVWPAWFGRMPYIPVRIQADIDNNP